MWKDLRTSISLLAILTLLTGVAYPVAVTLVAQAAFNHRANGSILRAGGRTVGSELIGQPFSQPKYFWGRLSATAPYPCNGAASTGSNLGPLNPALVEAVDRRLGELRRHDAPPSRVPIDLVTSSGSGLDPHISPAAADWQVTRVAAARKMTVDQVRERVRRYTEGRQLGVLGEPRVNVLLLNLDLDQLQPSR
jgi:K+-transporting ATPase ATPase C chain